MFDIGTRSRWSGTIVQDRMLRSSLLYLSRQKNLRRWMETSAAAKRLTARFVAGQTLDDVMRVSRKLHGENVLASLDHLGENVTTPEEAAASRRSMEEALAEIGKSGLPATISIKLTQFGLDLSDDLCLRNVEGLAETAHRIGSRVEIDMESSEYTSRTLAIAENLHQRFGCVRSVLQAYLYRSQDDVKRLSRMGMMVRLCKGAYAEPPSVAFPDKRQVDENYLKLSRLLLEEGTYPAFATHDPRMVEGVLAAGRPKDGYEFQMLYGVRRDVQKRLVAEGCRLRLYVPYGDAWYPYFMRRLAERPANVLFLVRNLMRA